MDILKLNKMKEIILFFFVLTFSFFIFRFFYFTADDYSNHNKCENSNFVGSSNIIVKFSSTQINENLKILIIQKGGIKKMIRYPAPRGLQLKRYANVPGLLGVKLDEIDFKVYTWGTDPNGTNRYLKKVITSSHFINNYNGYIKMK